MDTTSRCRKDVVSVKVSTLCGAPKGDKGVRVFVLEAAAYTGMMDDEWPLFYHGLSPVLADGGIAFDRLVS